MNLPEKFKNEDERINAIQEYENSGGSDTAEIDKINAIPLEEEPKPEPDEEQPEEEMPVEEVEEKPPEEKPPETPPAETPPPTDKGDKPPEEKGKPEARNWTVKEEDISKETYWDPVEKRERPFITHKNFADLQQSYVKNQKHTYHVEHTVMPRAIKEAEDRVRAEKDKEIADLKKQHEGKPVAAPAAPAAPATPTPAAPPVNLKESATALNDAIKAVKEVDPEKAFEHAEKTNAALIAAVEHIEKLTGAYSDVLNKQTDVTNRLTTHEQEQQRSTQQLEAEKQQADAAAGWQRVCTLVDQFASTDEFKNTVGAVDQTFDSMSKDAITFHAQIAGELFNKTPAATTSGERKAAVTAYLRPDNQELIDGLKSKGIDEPKNYQKWLILDQIDALRAGHYRDPVSKEWRRLIDPVTRQPVLLGDMPTAFGKFLDITGLRKRLEEQRLQEERDAVTAAVNKRDDGIVSMDTNQLRDDGEGAEITEQQAINILESIDEEAAMVAYMSGDTSKVEAMDRARKRLGMPPVDRSAFDAPVLSKK